LSEDPDRLDARLVPMKERVFVAMKDDRFYIFRYVDTDAAFNAQAPVFEHCVRSVRMK
jgi:hypothetical protein